jgi:hypothetical protein
MALGPITCCIGIAEFPADGLLPRNYCEWPIDVSMKRKRKAVIALLHWLNDCPDCLDCGRMTVCFAHYAACSHFADRIQKYFA